MENLSEIAKVRGYVIVVEANPICWEAGLDVTPDDTLFSLVPVAGRVAVIQDRSIAVIGEWLTTKLPIGAFCPKSGIYGSSCGHQGDRDERGQAVPAMPTVRGDQVEPGTGAGVNAVAWTAFTTPSLECKPSTFFFVS